MQNWFLSLFFLTLILLAGVLSQKMEQRHHPKCKNPKGKLWDSILNGECGQSVCKRNGKKASWQKCPRPATEEKIDKLNETMKIDNEAIMAAFKKLEELVKTEARRVEEKVDNVCGIPATALPTIMEEPSVKPTVEPLAVVNRFSVLASGWNVGDDRIDAIDFVPSKDISIKGISLYQSPSVKTVRFTGSIRVKEDSSKAVIASQIFDFTDDNSKTYYDQLFTTPGNLKAGVKYTITLAYDGEFGVNDILYGTSGQASVSADCGGDSVTFQFSDSDDFDGENDNQSDKTRGQIPRILFSC